MCRWLGENPQTRLITTISTLNITGLNQKNLSKRVYPDLPSARCTVPHSAEVPISTFHQLPALSQDEFNLYDVPFDTDQGRNNNYGETSSNP